MGKIWISIFYPNTPWRGVLKKQKNSKLVIDTKLQNMICRTHKKRTKSKKWALYLKNWTSYGNFFGSRWDKILLYQIFQISISIWVFEIGASLFACDHHFYRFQNDFLQHRVQKGSFVDFQGVALSAPQGFVAISYPRSERVKVDPSTASLCFSQVEWIVERGFWISISQDLQILTDTQS